MPIQIRKTPTTYLRHLNRTHNSRLFTRTSDPFQPVTQTKVSIILTNPSPTTSSHKSKVNLYFSNHLLTRHRNTDNNLCMRPATQPPLLTQK